MESIQELILKIIEQTKFNEFDGEKIAKWLRENPKKWISVLFLCEVHPLIILRDLPSNLYNADTLYILVKKENVDVFRELAKKWNADEFSVTEQKGDLFWALGTSQVDDLAIVRMWWD